MITSTLQSSLWTTEVVVSSSFNWANQISPQSYKIENTPQTKEQHTPSPADESFSVGPIAGGSSSGSRSSVSLTIAKKNPKVSVAHACTAFVQKEH